MGSVFRKAAFLVALISVSALSVAQSLTPDEQRAMLQKAEQGDANAQTGIGAQYEVGSGIIPQNYAESAKWYERAAKQGHAGAQYYLAIYYEEGTGVSQDFSKAKDLYGEACKNAGGGVSCDDFQRLEEQLVKIAHANNIPRYDPEAICQEIAFIHGGSSTAFNNCIDAEQESYNFIKKSWGSLSKESQDYCLRFASTMPKAYFVLEECVEIELDAGGPKKSFQF